MKPNTFLKYALLIAGLIGAAGTQAFAQAQQGGGGAGRGGFGVLTQEQRTKMRETVQADLTPLMEKLVAAQKEAVTAALAENASEATVKAKLEAVSKIQTDLALLRFKGVKAIASTLTAEQKTQLSNSRDGGYNALLGMMGGGARGARSGGGGGGGGNQ
jgi:Spy/CpxP family protein refolding chaperone